MKKNDKNDIIFEQKQEIERLEYKIDDKDTKLKIAVDILEESDSTICRLCVRLNPQHKDCTQCDDRDYLLEQLNKIKEYR